MFFNLLNLIKDMLFFTGSYSNNVFPELAKQTVLDEIKTDKNFPIYVAPRDKPSDFFEVS